MDCWLCRKEMTIYTSRGQLWCASCNIIYVDGTRIHIMGVNVPYVLYQGVRWRMEDWERMMKLKAFW